MINKKEIHKNKTGLIIVHTVYSEKHWVFVLMAIKAKYKTEQRPVLDLFLHFQNVMGKKHYKK